MSEKKRVRLCVYVCVCERERERGFEVDWQFFMLEEEGTFVCFVCKKRAAN